MQAREILIMCTDGLRAAKAAMFVEVAETFDSLIFVEKGNKKINAKSLTGVLSLGAKQGEKIYIFAEGKDEEQALDAIELLCTDI